MKGKRLVLWVLIGMAARDLAAQTSMEGISYVNSYKSLAMEEMKRSGIPAAVILAQGLHETQAGTSDLVKQSNNHFGIKCKDDWKGNVVYHDDDSRGECFRSYATAADSYRDHSEFLKRSSRYSFLFDLDASDYEGWCYGLKKAGYATNIRYSQILIKLIKDYNLQQYSLIAMGKMKPSEELVLTSPGAAPVPAGTAGTEMLAMGRKNDSADGTVTVRSVSVNYPAGEFLINKTRVVYVQAGTSLLSIAEKYELSLPRLLEFNDMKEEDVLTRDQLIFLQRKRRVGAVEFHVVQEGESAYDISQSEGIRYQDLLEMNQLTPTAQPAAGEKIYLQNSAPSRPRLVEGKNSMGNADTRTR